MVLKALFFLLQLQEILSLSSSYLFFFRHIHNFLCAISPVYTDQYPYRIFPISIFYFLLFFCLTLYYQCCKWLLQLFFLCSFSWTFGRFVLMYLRNPHCWWVRFPHFFFLNVVCPNLLARLRLCVNIIISFLAGYFFSKLLQLSHRCVCVIESLLRSRIYSVTNYIYIYIYIYIIFDWRYNQPGFDPSFGNLACLATLMSSDRTKVCMWMIIYIYIYIYIYMYILTSSTI